MLTKLVSEPFSLALLLFSDSHVQQVLLETKPLSVSLLTVESSRNQGWDPPIACRLMESLFYLNIQSPAQQWFLELSFRFVCFMCMSILLACLCIMCVWCLQRSEEGVEWLWAMTRHWEQEPGPLEGQHVLLTTELFLYPKGFHFSHCACISYLSLLMQSPYLFI